MRTRKITLLILATLLIMGITACNIDNDRPLTRGYDTSPDGLGPYTYDTDYRNGMLYNRYDDNRYDDNRFGTRNRYMDDVGPDRDFGLNGDRANRFRTNVNADADRMAEAAAKVKGVDDATVVIAGRTAYVALDIDDGVANRRAENVERNVYNSLKKFTNRYNISITSDADLFGRLRDIGDGIRGGAPADRYQTDFRDFDNRFRTTY